MVESPKVGDYDGGRIQDPLLNRWVHPLVDISLIITDFDPDQSCSI